MLKLDVKVGDTIDIDSPGRFNFRVADKSGQRVRLEFDAPNEIKIRTIKDAPNAAVPRKVLPPLVR